MCQKCIRANKNNRGKLRFGLVKVFTHGKIVPLFCDRASNLAIEAHLTRIRRARTARRYSRKATK